MHQIISKDVDMSLLHTWLRQHQHGSIDASSLSQLLNFPMAASEAIQTTWLIDTFNQVFEGYNVVLMHAIDGEEPEYRPATATQPARIMFANRFFSSALHEISHWCIAGNKRRTLLDYGYWYVPDGRSIAEQKKFEIVEIKPQAIECLFTLMFDKPFYVSIDNLTNHAAHPTAADTLVHDAVDRLSLAKPSFAHNVYHQVLTYLSDPSTLPKDTKTLLTAIWHSVTTSNH